MSSPTIPTKMKQIQVVKLVNNFREATKIVEVPVPKPGRKQCLIKLSYAMLNASEVLFTSGLFTPWLRPPFGAGLEAMGTIVEAGKQSEYKVGQHVTLVSFHCFGEYTVVDDERLFVIPTSTDPTYGAISVSGTTAYCAITKKCDLKEGDVVLVTAAAGATGHLALQMAKLAGCHVIGTCSSDDKVAFLKSIGCDRPINYKKESVEAVLKKEYPNGFNVAFECVGNEMFDICVRNVATKGRIISVGTVDVYQKEDTIQNQTCSVPLPFSLLLKSADLMTVYMMNYQSEITDFLRAVSDLYESKKLKIATDNGAKSEKGPFKGLEMVADAIDHLFSRKSVGKICVAI